jgi:hypothetical protein
VLLEDSTIVKYCRNTPLIGDIAGRKQFLPLAGSGISDGKIHFWDKHPGSATPGCKFHADPDPAFWVNSFWIRIKGFDDQIVNFYN